MVSFKTFRGGKNGIQESKTEKSIGPDEVLVRVTHSGLCGTDLHFRTADMVLGHEGVGLVEALGDNVTLFKKGDRVGWGYEHNACGHCKQCLKGRNVFCPDKEEFGKSDHDQGSFAHYSVRRADFLFAIPEGLSLSDAAPLQCGGATVFAALHDYGVKPAHRVGVVGVGGLGHLAIQFAAKMGCEVVVFSGTDSKKDEALRLGAREFHATKGVKALADLPLGGKIDHLLVTTAVQPDWEQYLTIMEPEGTIFPLTVDPVGNLSVPYMPWLGRGIRLQASVVACRETHQAMLRFAAVHGVKPIVQEFPMTLEGINTAIQTLDEGKMRYRGVLVTPTP